MGDLVVKVDTKEKAIELAKKDSDVRKYVENWKKQGNEIVFNVQYEEKHDVWLVWCQPKQMITGPYEIYIKLDGSILKKRYVPEG